MEYLNINIKINDLNTLLGVLSIFPVDLVHDVSEDTIIIEISKYINSNIEKELLRKYYKKICSDEIIFYVPLLQKRIEYELMYDSSLDTLSIVRRCDFMESETIVLIPSGIS